jgi:curved DNA-binding protein CbpA
MNDEIKSSFRVLDLEPTASEQDAKQAWRQLAKVWHPDRFPNDEKLRQRGQEKLKEINAAYEMLQDYFENPSHSERQSQPPQRPEQTEPETPKPFTQEPRVTEETRLDFLKFTIKEEIEKQFAQNPPTRTAILEKVSLSSTISNQYKGYVVVTLNGKTETIGLNVWAGEDNIQWEREKLSIERSQNVTTQKANNGAETILYAPCDCCGKQVDFPESWTGDKVKCPSCGKLTFLPYGAAVRRKGKPQSPKPFESQNESDMKGSVLGTW